MRYLLAVLIILTAANAQPLQNRLMLAVSDDGLRFTKLHRVVFNEADVPDAIVASDGRVFVYFQGNLPPARDAIIVGTSPDGENGWSFQPVSIQGIGAWKVRPCDPDVIYRDGLFRLYMTGDPTDDHVPETYSAVSSDGIHFTLEPGARFSGGSRSVLDPSLLWIRDTLHFFAGGGGPDRNWHALSVDGLSFTALPEFSIGAMMMSNGIALPEGYRFYGFTNKPPPNIVSIYSADGNTWTADAGPRLEVDRNDTLEANYVKDPAIVLREGRYLMYYVTRKPEFAAAESEASMPRQPRIISIHPQPLNATGEVAVEMPHAARIHLDISDALGRMIQPVFDGRLEAGTHALPVSTAFLAPGMYFMRVTGPAAAAMHVFVVTR